MINVNKILELSETGFRLESGWKTCDKFHVRSKPLFKDLKVGDEIDNLTFHLDKKLKNEYVMSFTVLNHEDQGEEVKSSLNMVKQNDSLSLNSLQSNSLPVYAQSGGDVLERGKVLNPQQSKDSFNSNSVQDNIRPHKDGQLYGLCLKLAFNNISARGLNLEVKEIRNQGKHIADLLYEDFGGN